MGKCLPCNVVEIFKDLMIVLTIAIFGLRYKSSMKRLVRACWFSIKLRCAVMFFYFWNVLISASNSMKSLLKPPFDSFLLNSKNNSGDWAYCVPRYLLPNQSIFRLIQKVMNDAKYTVAFW